MVDRITPATTAETGPRVAGATGRPALAPVLTEDFTEWAIEDRAAGPLPDWTAAGARIVADVAPFERRKLLSLNAAHSALAYGGLGRGHVFVHEAIADPDLLRQVQTLWAEAAPLLPEFPDAARATYLGALVARFSVAGMAHRLAQIAADGSVKIPQRILPILRHHAGRAEAATRVLADWWRLMEARAADGVPLDDPAEADLLDVIGKGDAGARFARACEVLGLSAEDMPPERARDLVARG
jgi:fructuronate reductase